MKLAGLESSRTEAQREPKLLGRMRDDLRMQQHRYSTECCYLDWTQCLILFHCKRDPKKMDGSEIRAFLTHFTAERLVSASTKNRANQWIARKYVAGADDLTETLPDVSGLMLFEMLDGALEVLEHVG